MFGWLFMTVQTWHYCNESQSHFKFWPMIFSQVSWIWCRIAIIIIIHNSSHRLQVASALWASCDKKEKLLVFHGACCCNVVVVRKFRILIFCQIRIYLTSNGCLGVWLCSKPGSICIKSEALSYIETFYCAFLRHSSWSISVTLYVWFSLDSHNQEWSFPLGSTSSSQRTLYVSYFISDWHFPLLLKTAHTEERMPPQHKASPANLER